MTTSPFISQLDTLISKGPLTPQQFQKLILGFYKSSGRSFPWRKTDDPYKILVSEVMLQQTQTERVEGKYREFLRHFPTVRALSNAPLADLLAVWTGLGYYRRALNLHRAAKVIVDELKGEIPNTVEELRALPGIGPYTAAAVAAFAFNAPVPMIETNIRALYLYTFFSEREEVHDREILAVIDETLYRKDPRTWFYALMDCGVELKKYRKKVHHRSKHHAPQSRFEGSLRQVRAAVLTLITQRSPIKETTLKRSLPYENERIEQVLSALASDGFIEKSARGYEITR
jgi:A/G-specific adenine glycosylase